MTDRRSFTVKQRLAIYSRQNGLCAICGLVMQHGQYEIDHELALIAGGDNSDGNLRAVHPKCHSDKTGDDARSHRKVQRVIAGGTKRKGRPLDGTRASGIRNSGVRWLSVPPPGKSPDEMQRELRDGTDLFSAFWNAPIERIAVENPVMHKHAKVLIRNYREPAQSVQPWQFGHGETKRTCLWLKNLPPLRPTEIVDGREPRVHYASPGPDRWKFRSRFFPGIADAMATQWPEYVESQLRLAA